VRRKLGMLLLTPQEGASVRTRLWKPQVRFLLRRTKWRGIRSGRVAAFSRL